MIAQLARDAATVMRSQGFPVSVYYGPDRLDALGVESHEIRFDVDRGRSGAWAPPNGSRVNPRQVGIRSVPVVVDVRARANVDGATQRDHDAELGKLVDGLCCAIAWVYQCEDYDWKRPPFNPSSFDYPKPENAYTSERMIGAVCQIRFALGRAVERKRYDGTAREEAVLAKFNKPQVTVRKDGAGAETV